MKIKKLKINNIEECKKCFKIHFENFDTLKVSKEIYFTECMYKYEELSEELYVKFYNLELINICEKVAKKYLASGLKTSARLKLYLSEKKFTDEVIYLVVKKLIDEERIDDYKYGKKYALNKMKNQPVSRKLLLFLLIQKGVSEDLSIKIIDDMNIDDSKNAKIILNKKFKNKAKDIKKAYKYLISKGYEEDVIFSIMKMEF